MTLVLRKSFGQFSAGTVVTQIVKNDGVAVYEATYTEVEYFTDYNAKRQHRTKTKTVEIAVPPHYITELRNRTDFVPAIPREKREDRVARRHLYKMLQEKV
jgi:hypothetical protein